LFSIRIDKKGPKHQYRLKASRCYIIDETIVPVLPLSQEAGGTTKLKKSHLLTSNYGMVSYPTVGKVGPPPGCKGSKKILCKSISFVD